MSPDDPPPETYIIKGHECVAVNHLEGDRGTRIIKLAREVGTYVSYDVAPDTYHGCALCPNYPELACRCPTTADRTLVRLDYYGILKMRGEI